MSGIPSQSEIQLQWKNAVAILETLRAVADGTIAGAGGKIDALMQVLEGEYTPSSLSAAAIDFRAGLSALVSPATAQRFIVPCLREYGDIITAGSGYKDINQIKRSIYEYFISNSLSVKSRSITFDTTATLGGTNVGNGSILRLTVDENDMPIESCYVETKRFRCRADQSTGATKEAEQFEHLGSSSSYDFLLRTTFGSGETARVKVTAKHAGSGDGGSMLRNGSFEQYTSGGTPKFLGWTETLGGAQLNQDTTNTYRGYPGIGTPASLKITGGGGQVTVTQPLTAMNTTRLDAERPYFLRVMLNKTIGTASGGTVTLRLGAATAAISIASLGSGWQELRIALDANCWPRAFNAAPFTVSLDWSSSSSGYLLVDDMIFCPWDQIDGTYWVIRQAAATPVAWALDDTLEFTDTGGAAATAKIQYWLWVAGLGYLPTDASPTFTDPA